MVSFQCNACGDVCTKPKLDKHRGQCQSSFDCIDCGKRFNTPAEYKDHTTCISEAEKYQKGLYKGGKQNGNRGGRNDNQRPWSSRNGGGQHSDSRPGWGRTISRATGANETPLGTPIRMSPINDTPPSPPKAISPAAPLSTIAPAASHVQDQPSKKRKSPSDETISIDAGTDNGELPKKKKSKTASNSVDFTDKPNDKKSKKDKKKQDTSLNPLSSSPDKSAMESPEGDKKKHETKTSESRDKKRGKKRSKSKSKKDDEGLDTVTAEPGSTAENIESADSKPEKCKRDRAEESVAMNGVEKGNKKKKRDKSKKHKDLADLRKPDPIVLDSSVQKVPEVPVLKRSKKSKSQPEVVDESNP